MPRIPVVVPPRPRVPTRHMPMPADGMSLNLDERAFFALDALARARGANRCRTLRDLLCGAYKLQFGEWPPGSTLDAPRQFTDAMKRAYQNAYSAAYHRVMAASKVNDRATRQRASEAGRLAGRRAARALLKQTP